METKKTRGKTGGMQVVLSAIAEVRSGQDQHKPSMAAPAEQRAAQSIGGANGILPLSYPFYVPVEEHIPHHERKAAIVYAGRVNFAPAPMDVNMRKGQYGIGWDHAFWADANATFGRGPSLQKLSQEAVAKGRASWRD